MPTPTRAPRRRKKATKASIDRELLAIRPLERAQWLEKNRAALDAYNDHVDMHGVFSDSSRAF